MTFDNILFAVDFSDHSRALNQEVEWLANHFRSQVTLLHVFEIPGTWYGAMDGAFVMAEPVKAVADCTSRWLNDYRLNIPEDRLHRVLIQGDPAWHITQQAKQRNADLVVIGTHGYGRLRGLLLGSVTAKVMQELSCPVWTKALHNSFGKQKQGIANIVCAVEITDEAVPLLKFTNQLARQLGSNVQVVHSVPAAETRPNKYFDFDLHRYLAESSRVEIAKLQREAETNFPLTVGSESISQAIAGVAAASEAGLVVVGRGKSQETFGRLRTHVYEIVREAPCSVLSYSPSWLGGITACDGEEHLVQCGTDAAHVDDYRSLTTDH